ncbi:hypothetical protein ZHAS_00015245 [Anopheles sinensis]|uniref:Uncharacterized protein n=1 Tax=Anopheles sinensis TaxID=74873 RepID=A0A084WAF1_ANOSI|nr:hypothetical protein ZHAS_00015245 [Anopheles sinensis]
MTLHKVNRKIKSDRDRGSAGGFTPSTSGHKGKCSGLVCEKGLAHVGDDSFSPPAVR